jgi:fibronectin type 3 domain-containing protein
MENVRVRFRFLLAASAMAFYLSGCGGSSSSSPPSSAASTTDKTAAWTNVSVRAFDGKVNINWDKAAGSTFGSALSTYNIYCSNNPTDIMQDSNRIATNYPGTSFDHTNVINGQRYYYAVTVVSATGEGPASLTVSATPQEVLPAAPYGLKVTAQDSAAKLEYMGPTPTSTVAASYNLYRSTTRNFTAKDIIGFKIPFTTPYSDTPLTNNTTYYYAVTTVISGKESGFSPIVSARPQATVAAVGNTLPLNQLAAFASPADMSVEPRNGSCVITWSGVNDLTIQGSDPAAPTPDYILYWSNLQDVITNKIDQIDNITKNTADAFTYTLSGLNNGTTYFLQVAATVKGSDGTPVRERFTPGPVVSVTPAAATPAIPSGVSATQGTREVSLTWNKDTSGITGVTYRVYYSTTDVKISAELMKNAITNGTWKNVDKAYFTYTGLDLGTTYYYVVTAVGEGESAPSSIVSATL